MICAYCEAVVAKVLSQGCKRRGDLDDEFSLYFSIEHREAVAVFCIPQPLYAGGYTASQLEVVEVQLARLGIDLLPMDPYLN